MKKLFGNVHCGSVILLTLLAVRVTAAGVDRFVIKDHPAGDGNYLTWETAAPNIQSAIDAANAGDTIWVTNGVYDTGGRVSTIGTQNTTNRVVIDKAVTVRSVGGSTETIIKGDWDASDPNGVGPAAVRGVYMQTGSTLIGFTVTNGFTRVGGGAHWDGSGGGIQVNGTGIVISNCVVVGNTANANGGGIARAYTGTTSARIYNTVIKGNRALTISGGGVWGGNMEYFDCEIIDNRTQQYGGGGNGGTYYNCLITGNHANAGGGGARSATLFGGIVSSNSSGWTQGGGGIRDSTAYHVLLIGNEARTLTSANRPGGGALFSTLYNCTLIGNAAGGPGGGADGSVLYNCLVIGNQAQINGGGTRNSTLYNVTLVGNRYISTHASYSGGGVHGGTVYNSIIVNNTGTFGTNYAGAVVFTNSLTYPEQVGWAEGNITNAPIFFDPGSGYGLAHVAGDYRLQSHSPGMNAGMEFDWMTEPQFEGDIRHLDLEGNPRIGLGGVVDMGAYEYVYVLGTIILMH